MLKKKQNDLKKNEENKQNTKSGQINIQTKKKFFPKKISLKI